MQSAIFDGYQRRVVMPLVKKALLGRVHHARFNPSFTIKGVTVVLHPLDIVSVPEDKLSAPVASRAAHGPAIIDAWTSC